MHLIKYKTIKNLYLLLCGSEFCSVLFWNVPCCLSQKYWRSKKNWKKIGSQKVERWSRGEGIGLKTFRNSLMSDLQLILEWHFPEFGGGKFTYSDPVWGWNKRTIYPAPTSDSRPPPSSNRTKSTGGSWALNFMGGAVHPRDEIFRFCLFACLRHFCLI